MRFRAIRRNLKKKRKRRFRNRCEQSEFFAIVPRKRKRRIWLNIGIGALNEHVQANCIIRPGIPFGETFIAEVYLMLLNQFENQLSAEIVRIASELYYDRTAVAKGLDVTNPTGFFQTCYKDAVKLYKLNKNTKGRK